MPAGGPADQSLSDILGPLALGGRTWCYADLGAAGGFSVPHGDAAFFHAVLHGSLRATSPGGGTIELAAGEAVFVLSGEAHALRVATGSPAPTLDFLREERGVDVPPSVGPIGSGGTGAPVARVLSARLMLDLPTGASRQALPAFLRLDSGPAALLRPEALARAGIGPGAAALLTRLAGLMLVAQLRVDPACRSLFAPEKPDPIAQALALIAGNPSASWTVERLARSVGMGRSNFAAHFTGQVGRAPMEVVAEQRMVQAAGLLQKGNLKIAEISELAGYGSEAAFSRRFTRHFGVTPSQMRETLRAEESAAVATADSWSLLGRRISGPASRPAASASPPTVLGMGRMLHDD